MKRCTAPGGDNLSAHGRTARQTAQLEGEVAVPNRLLGNHHSRRSPLVGIRESEMT